MPVPTDLPTPNADEVKRYRDLFRATYGVDLSEEQADDQARRLVQFVFLVQHALPRLRKSAERPDAGPGSH